MNRKYIVIAAIVIGALLSITAIGYCVYLLFNKATDNSISIVTDDRIDITPQQIRSIRDIGEWEFLSISDEQLVDTVRRGIFFDDQLVRIYYGTLRLGIDMQQLRDDAFVIKGDGGTDGYEKRDTLCVTLPPVKLLDDDFIDEARTRSFISKGNWDTSVREALYYKARQKMIDQCMTRQNIKRARENAVIQVSDMLNVMGFENVIIKFEN